MQYLSQTVLVLIQLLGYVFGILECILVYFFILFLEVIRLGVLLKLLVIELYKVGARYINSFSG